MNDFWNFRVYVFSYTLSFDETILAKFGNTIANDSVVVFVPPPVKH